MSVTTYDSGSGNWTAPDDGYVVVEAWGGGAGGRYDSWDIIAPGGGGGAYAKKNHINVTKGSSYAYSVGAGGGSASPGGDSYFIDSSTLLAVGAPGQSGGSSSSCVGDVKTSGQNGTDGWWLETEYFQYGDGGDAGNTSDTGGIGYFADYFNDPNSEVAGTGGTAPGGGGGGCYDQGYPGANGRVVITFYPSSKQQPLFFGAGF